LADSEASFRPADARSLSWRASGLQRQLLCYVVVGGLSVVVDVGLLVLLHESFAVPIGIATTVAFSISLVLNFLLNRTAMSSWGTRGLTQHALRYASLVVANYVITLVVVTTVAHVSTRYVVAKLAVVAGSTSWNFLLYRHWVFKPPRSRPTSSKRERVPGIGKSPRHDGVSAEPSRHLLVPIPAFNETESSGQTVIEVTRRERPTRWLRRNL
jgi:putative flippase GtrA